MSTDNPGEPQYTRRIMALSSLFPSRRAEPENVAPDFLDLDHKKTRRQLERSCERHLPFASAGVSGEPVREFYLSSVDLQTRYPLALLPVAQKRMAKWLLKQGRAQHQFSDEQVLAFLRESATDLPRGIAETYLITPSWQERFPNADGQHLLDFLRTEFPEWRALDRCGLVPLTAPPAPDPQQLGVNLLAHFCYPSGLQQGALATGAALQHAGVTVACRDVPAGTRTELLPRGEFLELERFPISLLSMAPVPFTESAYARAGLYRRPGVYRIAYWLWELDAIPAEWPSFSGLIDEIWAPSRFIGDTMRRHFSVPVTEMPLPLLMEEPETVRRSEIGVAEDAFVFLFMFDMCSELDRKNPLGLIRAFRQAFSADEKVALLLKLVRAELDPAGRARLEEAAAGANVVIVNELASRARTLGFVELCDCYISLHRSEGYGFTMAEAMALGKPVIGTGYSGNVDFMNESNSFLVDYTLVEVETEGPNYQCGGRWAAPSEEHAAALMRSVWKDRATAAARAAQAHRDVTVQLAPEAVGRRMRKRLEEIRAS
ncbi:MAG: glycosyltransferase [Chthoniobacterales bacterium]|nr:glycosyltransferase [Chthoniobacterales bacterium]